MSYPCQSSECVHTHTLESCIPFHSTSCCVALYNDKKRCRYAENDRLHECLVVLSFHLECAVIPEEEFEKSFLEACTRKCSIPRKLRRSERARRGCPVQVLIRRMAYSQLGRGSSRMLPSILEQCMLHRYTQRADLSSHLLTAYQSMARFDYCRNSLGPTDMLCD